MFSRDLFFSLILHTAIIFAALFVSPLDFNKKNDFVEVIRVNAITPSELQAMQPIPEANTPEPIYEEIEADIPIDDPTTMPKAKINKPKPKPKKPKTNKPKPKATNREKSNSGPGDNEVETPSGSSLSGATVDNRSFTYPYWFDLAWNKLSRNFRIPISIDGKVYCDIYFQVIKSGRVIETKVVSPSGIPAFDKACLESIERTAPFPPLPKEFLDEIIGITLTFTN